MPRKKAKTTKKEPAEPPAKRFRVLKGCNAANGDRFEAGDEWPVTALTKSSREALLEMGAIEMVAEPIEE